MQTLDHRFTNLNLVLCWKVTRQNLGQNKKFKINELSSLINLIDELCLLNLATYYEID